MMDFLRSLICEKYYVEVENLKTIYQHTQSEIYVFDVNTLLFSSVNQVALDNIGYDESEISTLTPVDIKPEFDLTSFNELIHPLLTNEVNHVQLTTIHERLDGSTYPVEIFIKTAMIDNKLQFIASVTDITERKEQQEIIYNLAYYDTLTGLPNRTHFAECTNELIVNARECHGQFAFFLVDIDDFKRINDTMGHQAGDVLLKEIAVRLHNVVDDRCLVYNPTREDCHCFVARLGGDEFVLIVEQLDTTTEAESLANQVFASFDDPIIINDQEIYVKLSIGIGLYPHDGSSLSALLKSADLALYTAKEKGKNQFHFHEASMNMKMVEYLEYEAALRYFIDTGDFEMHYQPIVCIKSNVMYGAEALFRGNNSKYGNVPLEQIIRTAEETGMIVPLGRKILEKSCRDCKQCIELIEDSNFRIAVNVSIRELNEPDFVDGVVEILEKVGLSPNRLSLEVTESLFMVNYNENVQKLQRLKDMGVCLAIDDFGKGYSSMSYIQRLPTDKLKIDKQFIDGIEEDQKSVKIVRGITLMAQSLGMAVCAEGVETENQFSILSEIGVDQIQGFFFGIPQTLSDFQKFTNKFYLSHN